MDRAAWLAQRRQAVREQYDAEAPTYRTEGGDYPTPKHPAFIERLLAATPPDAMVLDAACGAGKWFASVREAGRRVVGADQSAGMVEAARALGLAERVEHIGLQELAFTGEFDAAMVIDAMENIGPEDWPIVAGNLARALKPGGGLFLTLEEQEDDATDAAFRALVDDGQPAVRGEVIEGDVAGYHYYPGRALALAWLTDAGFTLLDEDVDDHGDWGYRLLLLRRSSTG